MIKKEVRSTPSTKAKRKRKRGNMMAPEDIPGTPRLYFRIGAGLAILAFLLYANTLGHQYVLDDPLALSENAYVTKGFSGIPDLLTHHYRAGTEGASASALQYRPLSLIIFAIEWSLAPDRPFFYHLMNVLWYAFTVSLLFAALLRVFHGFHWLLAAGVAVLFAVHPLHTEVVANIKSRDEILAAFFCITALYFWARWLQQSGPRWIIFASIAFFLGLMSKENAVLMLPVFPLVSWVFFEKGIRTSARHLLVFAVPVAIFLLIRGLVLSQTTDSFAVSAIDNPVIEARNLGERLGTGFMVLWKYLQMLVFPHPLISDYSYRHLSIVNWSSWKSLIGIASYCGIGVVAILGVMRRHPLGLFTSAFLFGIVLYSQLPLVIGTLFGERLSYMPSLWFCCAAAYCIWNLTGLKLKGMGKTVWPPMKQIRTGLVLFILIIGLFALKTLSRNADWKDTHTLMHADVVKAPNSIRLHNGISSASFKRYQEQGDITDAEKMELLQQMEQHAAVALSIRRNPESLLNLGNVAYLRGQFEKAIQHYEESLSETPDYQLARTNMARAYRAWSNEEITQNNLLHATELLEKAIFLGEEDVSIYLNLGSAYAMLQQNEKAISNYEKALLINPNDRTVWKNLGKVYQAIGNVSKAMECERKAAGQR